uniref:Uncharacterized protein n=1 Tax=Timema bartmani TaxID=61472 RepID=A0A7R9F2E8_9NEOP|nr:unnamed protein product [Timema bartmani]
MLLSNNPSLLKGHPGKWPTRSWVVVSSPAALPMLEYLPSRLYQIYLLMSCRLASCIGNHKTKCRSAQTVTKDADAPLTLP